MASWIGTNGQVLPQAGEAFLVPVAEGQWTFAWVVGLHGKRFSEDEKRELCQVRIACARWIGARPPTQKELDAREVVELLDVRGKSFGPLVMHTEAPPPASWKHVGRLKKPSVEHASLWAGTFENIAFYVAQMWKAKHEPAKVKDQVAALVVEEAENAAEQKLVKARKRATLAQLSRLELLPEWESLTTKRRRTTVGRWLAELVASMRAAGPKATRKDKLLLIEAAVERINAWSGSTEIDSAERDALIDAIDDIGRAAGLRGRDLAGPYREW